MSKKVLGEASSKEGSGFESHPPHHLFYYSSHGPGQSEKVTRAYYLIFKIEFQHHI